MSDGVTNAMMSRAETTQPRKFTTGAPYQSIGSLVGVHTQKCLTTVANGSRQKSNKATSRTLSPMTRRPYGRDLRQGRKMRRATPRELRIAISHRTGMAQGRG